MIGKGTRFWLAALGTTTRSKLQAASYRLSVAGGKALPKEAIIGVLRTAVGTESEARLSRYIAWLRQEGYEFRGFDAQHALPGAGVAALRYDINANDLAAAWLLAAIHERLAAPATFALAWGPIERAGRGEFFRRLGEFDPRYVQFGLLAAPVADWLDETRPDRTALPRLSRAGEHLRLFSRLHAAWLEAGDTAREIAALRAGAERHLAWEAAAFHAALGAWPSIAGRNSPLAVAFTRRKRTVPALSVLDPLLDPGGFLDRLDLAGLGFAAAPSEAAAEATIALGSGSRNWLRIAHHERIWGRRGFIAAATPLAWTSQRLDDLASLPPLPPDKPRRARHARLPAVPVLTRFADLLPFGRGCDRVAKARLVQAARAKVGDGIERTLLPFIAWLQNSGYGFADFENGAPRFGERLAYLRYDVHVQDLLAAYVIADLHERLQIPGSFQITWRFSTAEMRLEPFFARLREFDPRHVQFGLHCAPTATWFIEDKCGGSYQRAVRAAGSAEFADWLARLAAAFRTDGAAAPEIAALRTETETWLGRLAASFRANYGDWRSVSGHGNFLTGQVKRSAASIPGLADLDHYFNPVQFMARFGVRQFGFDHEVTGFARNHPLYPSVICEDNPLATLRDWYHGRVGQGLGFVAMFHPATLTCSQFATLARPPAIAGWHGAVRRGR